MRLTYKGRPIVCNRPNFFAHGAVDGRMLPSAEEMAREIDETIRNDRAGLGQAEEPETVDKLTSFLQKYGDIIKLGTTVFLAVRFFSSRK